MQALLAGIRHGDLVTVEPMADVDGAGHAILGDIDAPAASFAVLPGGFAGDGHLEIVGCLAIRIVGLAGKQQARDERDSRELAAFQVPSWMNR